MLNSLKTTASRVGLHVNVAKSEVLCVPGPQVEIFLDDNRLNSCQSFTYLGARIPHCSEDIQRRKRLAWTSLGKLQAIFSSNALSDELRVTLFRATVEAVLLYNAVTWTMTRSLEIELDGAHSHLLRAAFNIYWPQRVSNADLYRRAGLQPPSEKLREDRLKLVGELIRTEESCPQPAQRLLLWRPTRQQRRGQGNRKTFPQILFEDCQVPDQLLADRYVRCLAAERKI